MSKQNEHKSKIPYIFFAFFAVVIAVNVFYIYLSRSSWTGVISKDAYKEGLHYNKIIDSSIKQKKLGWSVEVLNTRTSQDKILMKFIVRDKNDDRVKGAQITAHFKRLDNDKNDFDVMIQNHEGAEGVYQTEVFFPQKGRWEAEFEVRKNDDFFALKQSYVVE